MTPSHVEGFVAHARSAQVCAHDCIISVAWHIDTNSSDEFQSLWIVTIVSAKGGWTRAETKPISSKNALALPSRSLMDG